MSTAFILGAGFSKCAGLPVQEEFSNLLIKKYWDTRRFAGEITENIIKFLFDVFAWEKRKELPKLEDIFTCIDLSASSGHDLALKYEPKHLRALRRMAIYKIFYILDQKIKESESIKKIINYYMPELSFIVLNWDIVLEKHLKLIDKNIRIDYCCSCYDWNYDSEFPQQLKVPICKMHGSANWVYCENCKSLYFDLNRKIALIKMASLNYADFQLFNNSLNEEDLGIVEDDRRCKNCDIIVSSHIATFSFRKSFRTHAYPSIWYNAEKYLSDACKWIFIGYSLPDADYEFKHLLKVAQLRDRRVANNREIIVIVKKDKEAENRFKRFFGNKITYFYNRGLDEYVSEKLS